MTSFSVNSDQNINIKSVKPQHLEGNLSSDESASDDEKDDKPTAFKPTLIDTLLSIRSNRRFMTNMRM